LPPILSLRRCFTEAAQCLALDPALTIGAGAVDEEQIVHAYAA
jgi:hypothetical protein